MRINIQATALCAMARFVRRFLVRVHDDQAGSISIVSVFGLVLLVMLFGLVVNSGRQVDQKIKMQNAADAATWSGGVVLARGMNTLAFTNHLLSDVFALTAFLREARDQSAQSLTPELLAAWERIGPVLQTSEFPKFAALGTAIIDKIPHERDMVSSYSNWAAAAAQQILPVLERVLAERQIPEFQRALVRHLPRLAQTAADRIAQRHGLAWPRPVELRAVLWRTSAEPVGSNSTVLPVVDPLQPVPTSDRDLIAAARARRRGLAERCLDAWNRESLGLFDQFGKMSQFSNLWRIFTCGQLRRLLEEEYPDTNLPHLLRTPAGEIDNLNVHLERDFMFVGVVYRKQRDEMMPGVFHNPLAADTQAYAQTMLFVPTRRLVWRKSQVDAAPNFLTGGVPGESVKIPYPRDAGPPAPDGVVRQDDGRHPERWDLFTQNWTLQLVPATNRAIPEILSTPPEVPGFPDFVLPNLRQLTPEEFQWLSNH